MRVLFDTNVVIHREGNPGGSGEVGQLFKWIDKLKYEKYISPITVREFNNFFDKSEKNVMNIKLESYNNLGTLKEPNLIFEQLISETSKDQNSINDNYLLYDVFSERVDILITDDREMLKKAKILNIRHKVFEISEFLVKCTNENPSLSDYKNLLVSKKKFEDIDLSDPFFDSFKKDYKEFEKWYRKKGQDYAYVCEDNGIFGFLYLKFEGHEDDYSDIIPKFDKKIRMKIGTFKVVSTGYRLGERFIQIIFQQAIKFRVEEIYVTLFDDKDEVKALKNSLLRWGFFEFGEKRTPNGIEKVLVKKLKTYDSEKKPSDNFPNIEYYGKKWIMPIFPKYHTNLFPDSKLNTEAEANIVGNYPHMYALKKIYISFTNPKEPVNRGDKMLIYRTRDEGKSANYSAVVTTLCIVDDIVQNISSEKELLSHCENRSVFSKEEISEFWKKYESKCVVLKLLYVTSFNKRVILGKLREYGIIGATDGPRPFTRITDEQYDTIVNESSTDIVYTDRSS